MSTIKMTDGTEVTVDDFNETPVDWAAEVGDATESVKVVVPDGESITYLDVEVDGTTVQCRLDLDDIDALIESLSRARRQAVRNGATYRPEPPAAS